ncbi:MAG: DUF3540 domain-containing protein [Deltaproteobacteria bacterium]|jgi:hypothetical protein|nr:DUF3540 domain-containing protein [Deltaproteobacteria bacterium]
MSLALNIADYPAYETAEVLAREGDWYRLLAHGLVIKAIKAYSCLIEPEKGDLVSYQELALGNFILAILIPGQSRADTATLALPERTTVLGENIAVLTDNLDLSATNLNAKTARVFWSGLWLRLNFTLRHQVSRKVVSLVDRLFSRVKTSQQESELTTIKADRLKICASKTLDVKSERLDLKAAKTVKIDGQLIELG